jgi:hypothetical protein
MLKRALDRSARTQVHHALRSRPSESLSRLMGSTPDRVTTCEFSQTREKCDATHVVLTLAHDDHQCLPRMTMMIEIGLIPI